MKIHQLKILDHFANEIAAGNESFVITKDDNYHTGDCVRLTVIARGSGKEIDHELNTRMCRITDILYGCGLNDGYVLLEIRLPDGDEREMRLD